MQTTLKRSAILTAAVLGLCTGTARAQEVITARIPFSFVVGNQQFPAGRYVFTQTEGVLEMRGWDNDEGMFALTFPAEGRDPRGYQPALVFTPYESTVKLAEIWNSEHEGSALTLRHGTEEGRRAATQAETIVAGDGKPE